MLFASQPEEVRWDLQRIAVSNHAVDATGEARRTRTTIPPSAMQVASRVLEAVRKFLLQLAKADVTDSATMKADTARDLAEAAMQGKYRIAAFITAARQLKGPHPPAAGSREELMAGFALMRKTWRCVHDQLGWTTLDIDTFDELVNSTGTGFILSVSDLTQYIRCVVDEYFELARSFRLHDGAPPSLAVAIAERKQGYDLKAVRSSILKGQRPQHVATRATSDDGDAPKRRKKRVRPRDRKQPRAQEPDSSATSSSGEAEQEPSPKPARAAGSSSKAPPSAFPQLKQIGAAEREKATREIRTKFRKHCSNFLIGKCTRDGKCSYTHAVPSGFKAAARTSATSSWEQRQKELLSSRKMADLGDMKSIA